jgi:hypothetical protein
MTVGCSASARTKILLQAKNLNVKIVDDIKAENLQLDGFISHLALKLKVTVKSVFKELFF